VFKLLGLTGVGVGVETVDAVKVVFKSDSYAVNEALGISDE